MPEPDLGLASLGEYSGRETTSQTAQTTITTKPAESQQTAPPPTPPAPVQEPPPKQEPAVPADLVSDLSKAFAKTIGELPPEKPPEPHSVDDPNAVKPPPEKTWRDAEPPAHVTKKVAEDWRTFRSQAQADISARDAKIKELESQLESSKAYEPQLTEAKKRAEEAIATVERVAIERSPLFKTKVLDQEALLKARMGALVDGTGIQAGELDTLLRGDLNTRERMLESRQMSAYRRQQIADTLSKWDGVAEERSQLLERGRETLQTYMREQQQAQETQRAEFARQQHKVFEDQMALVCPKLEVYTYIDGNDAWNKSCDTLKSMARRLYDGNVTPQMVAQAAILAPAAIAYQNLLRSAYGKIQELQEQVNKYRGVQPTVRDTGGDISQPGQVLSSPNGDFVKNLVDRFKKDTGLQ